MHSSWNNLTIFVGLVGFILIGRCSSSPLDEFGYHGDRGPSHWADNLHYGSCVGKYQSPIDIEESFVIPVRLRPLLFKGFNAIPISSTLTNNGHTVMLKIRPAEQATVTGGPLQGEYIFSQLHFHWGANDSVGSEDLINNHSFPMELHMVFFKMDYGDMNTAMNFKDGLAVLAVFYDSFDFDNSVYSEIVEHLDSVTLPHSEVRLHAPMTLDDLLPANKHSYFTYNGSLTTPPCSEVVTWLDFKEPIPLSHDQIAAFRRLRSTEGQMTENFRPVQPLGNRHVYVNVGEKPVQKRRIDEDFDSSTSTDPGSNNGVNTIPNLLIILSLLTLLR